MYSGVLIGQRIQSSGFSSVPSRSPTTAPTPTTTNTNTNTNITTTAAVAAAAASAPVSAQTQTVTTAATVTVTTTTTVSDSKRHLIQQQWSTILPGVNGKVTVECLWNACRAILIGMTLIAIGAAMATVGYYANELSLEEQTTGNLTVQVKNASRGFHLNNLSYVGPIIMGFGGFILVATCVMTFEARDNASKIVPTRYHNKLRDTTVGVTNGGQINTLLFNNSSSGVSQLLWDVHRACPSTNIFQLQQQQQQQPQLQPPSVQQFAGSWESSTGSQGELPLTLISDRISQTADFVNFSKTLQTCIESKQPKCLSREVRLINTNNVATNLNHRSPSAPDLIAELGRFSANNINSNDGNVIKHIYSPKSYYSPVSYCRWHPRQQFDIKRTGVFGAGVRLIKAHNLSFLPRQAISVDNPRADRDGSPVISGSMMASPTGNANAVPKSESDASMTMDLHFPDGSITLMVKDESKQSKQGDGNSSNNANNPNNAQDKTKRPPLLRQCRVEHADSELEFNNPG
ncbi:hypothetical protein CHUAL_005638 [Chamberlinius hualienensis]